VNGGEYLHLLGERTALARMLAETPEEDVIDRASLSARLKRVEAALAEVASAPKEPERVRLTFRGQPVVGSYGVFVEFGMKAVHGFAESVTALAASLTGPLAASGPIPNRGQHQLLITNTAIGSFGFELEAHRTAQSHESDASTVTQALERTLSILRGTQGSDEELADAAAEADRRVLDKVRAFLGVLADHEAVCAVVFGETQVSFTDVGQVRTSIARLSQENVRDEPQQLTGVLQGVLPSARLFEFRLSDSGQVIRGKISPRVSDPEALQRDLHRPVTLQVTVKRVGGGRPRYLLLEPPQAVLGP